MREREREEEEEEERERESKGKNATTWSAIKSLYPPKTWSNLTLNYLFLEEMI